MPANSWKLVEDGGPEERNEEEEIPKDFNISSLFKIINPLIELVWEQQPMIGIRKHLYLRRGLIESACVRAPASDLADIEADLGRMNASHQ
jgi:hypothetical protein